jgi:hypothetical protein
MNVNKQQCTHPGVVSSSSKPLGNNMVGYTSTGHGIVACDTLRPQLL